MILYVNEIPYTYSYTYKESILKESIEWFIGNIHTVTERNPIVIIDLITYYKPMLFLTYSIDEFDLSPTQISELILSIIKSDCVFKSIKESLYFEKEDYMMVYPSIFEIFKHKIHTN